VAAESKELRAIREMLHAAARPAATPIRHKFFKTGPGEYAEGDIFIGVKVPDTRRIVCDSDSLAEKDVISLLRSPIHEERSLALLILVRRYQRREADREKIVATFLAETKFINNWDLVDSSAPYILGPWLLDRDRAILRKLAKSKNLWERRIAILATFAFIRANDFACTLELAKTLLRDDHDLMHKAVGWMLREVGNRDEVTLRKFLDTHASEMPRTMLRYAIEKLPSADRAHYLAWPRALRSGKVFEKKRA
jgi:3-methyladenine DNA glycosylase AlkD